MKPRTDEELVRVIQSGDIVAFEELVKRYQRGLLSFVWRFLHDEAAAEDVVQDSLFKVYQAVDRIDPKRKFSTYLFEVAKNTAISALRANKKTVSLDAIAQIGDDTPFIEEYLRFDRIEAVRAAVGKLTSKYGRVIRLYYFDELSYEEIGKKLRMPVNTVRTHLRRAKEALKKELPYEL